jgi:hypothetical protein
MTYSTVRVYEAQCSFFQRKVFYFSHPVSLLGRLQMFLVILLIRLELMIIQLHVHVP